MGLWHTKSAKTRNMLVTCNTPSFNELKKLIMNRRIILFIYILDHWPFN